MDRILLVNDDVEVRPLLEHILLDDGYQVVPAGLFYQSRRWTT